MPRNYYSNYRLYQDPATAHSDRIYRAFDQHLQLIHVKYYPTISKWTIRISSSSGSGFYDINISPITATCDCPDFERRGKPCKHMLCVLLRILKLKDSTFTTPKQVAKHYAQVTETLLGLFHHNPDQPDPRELDPKLLEAPKKRKRKSSDVSLESPTKIKKEANTQDTIKEETPKVDNETPETSEEMCLICLLEFIPNADAILQCSSHCKRWLGHKECLQGWFTKSNLCPLCKGPQQKPKSQERSPTKRHSTAYDENTFDIADFQAQEDDPMIVSQAFFQIIYN